MAFSLFRRTQKEEPSGQKSHYHNLLVTDVVAETEDAISVYFDQPEPSIEYLPGQFLTLIVNIDGEEVRRAYSLCTSPYVDQNLGVSIKRVDGGLVSNYLNDHLKPGDEIKIMEPMGQFTTEYSAENKRHILMFGGGSGITPFMSLIKSTLNREPNSIVSLIYCNRNINSIIFKNTLDEIQTSFEGRFHVIHVLDNAPVNWQGPSGLLNDEMLKKLLERIPDWGIDNTTYLMCGPEGMMKNVESLLISNDIPTDKIFKESFVQGTIDKKEDSSTPAGIQAREVTILYDGQEHKYTVEPESTILETGLDKGIDLPFSCQSGLCTACRGKLLSGKVTMDEEEGLSQAEKEQGYVLNCVGHPLSDDVVIEIG